MTDSNAQTIDSNDIGTKLERLAANFDKLSDQLAKFSGAVVQTLSGQPQAPAAAPARRRGRPPKAEASSPAAAVTATTTAARKAQAVNANSDHPMARQAFALIEKAGRITQTELANQLKIERSAVEYHTNPLVADGKIVKRTVMPNGTKTILFYRRDWASFKGE